MNPARNNISHSPFWVWKTVGLLFTVCVGLCAPNANTAKAASDSNSLPLIPRPVESRVIPGEPFRIKSSTVIECNAESKETAARLVEALQRETGMTLKTNSTSAAEGNIVLRLEDEKLFPRLAAWQR